MCKKSLSFLGLIFVGALLTGCATIAEKARSKGAPGFVTGGVKSISIEGPTSARVGETITFKIVGYDEKSARIKIPGLLKSTTWKVDNPALGKLESTEGNTVRMKCLAPGVVTITAKHPKVKEESMTMVEIK
ncbi:MAG: hypothetical protein J7L42_00600 [Elusimicrobia bacterium]|nr:hypothetical protein [Elusimicrobiota bacterium]